MTVEVTPPDGAAQFAVWKQWVERQIVALGRARRLPNASLREGALDILADNGAVRARLGVQDDTRVAQTFYDADGNELIRLGEQSDGRFGQDVSSPTGTRVLRLGQLPDNRYGLAAYDDGGNELIRVGEQSDGRFGQTLYDASGNELIRLGEQPDGTTGLNIVAGRLTIEGDGALDILADDRAVRARFGKQVDGAVAATFYDASGNEMIRLGDRAGTHSLFVTSAGVTVDVVNSLTGMRQGFVATRESTTSEVPTNLATVGPSVTVTVGPSGRLWLMAGAMIEPSDASLETGLVYYSASGANIIGDTLIAAAGGTNLPTGTPAGGRLLTGLAPGETTLTLRYATFNSNAVWFEQRWLIAQPL